MVYNSPHYEGDRSTIQKDKDGGKFFIPAKALNIVWGRDSRYWKIPEKSDMPAELLQVSWLEVSCSVDETNPQKNYEVGFSVSLKVDAFGWNKYPFYIMMKRGNERQFSSKKVLFNGNGNQEFEISGKLMKAADSTDTKIYFGLYEVWSGKWKGGLKIHHAFVREAPT
ncbi:Protein PHLOEM PROTEIN 2-LIKE A9 [Abeliophyllum distichum]|uniref:Protein PHLOEM PROTEIN 2-LIKE A9 n=1 Tax=Abeliophyllum distichum TaxID=126358 RepID=A0ABD1PU37_9LAMI